MQSKLQNISIINVNENEDIAKQYRVNEMMNILKGRYRTEYNCKFEHNINFDLNEQYL